MLCYVLYILLNINICQLNNIYAYMLYTKELYNNLKWF